MIKMLTADAKHITRGKNHQIKYSSPENAMMELAWVSAIIHDHVYDVTLSKWSEMIGLKSEMGYSVVYTLTGRGKELSHEDKLPLYRNFKQTCKKKVHCIVGPMSGMHIPVFVLLDPSERWNAHSARAHALRFARQM